MRILMRCSDMRILKPKIIIHDSLGPPKSSTQMACRLVEPLLKGSLLWQIDRPTTLSVKELTTPSVKNNYFTVGVVGRYTSTETFHQSISTPFSHTRILLHCGGVQILKLKKTKSSTVLEIENRTELNWNWKIQTDPALPNSKSKAMKLTCFRRTSPQNHPEDTILRTHCIRNCYWPSACTVLGLITSWCLVFSAYTLGSQCWVNGIICPVPDV